jgi:hypothetical protein
MRAKWCPVVFRGDGCRAFRAGFGVVVVESVSWRGFGDNDRGGDAENATPIVAGRRYPSLSGTE